MIKTRNYWLSMMAATLFVFLFNSCNNDCNVECFTPPGPLTFKITDKNTGEDLVYNGIYIADSISIYYFDGDVKLYIDVNVLNDSSNQQSVIGSNDISWKSVEGFKDFFLYLNFQDTDSLYLDVVSKTENCCTSHPVVYFGINGNEVDYDTTDWVYDYKK